MKIQLDNPTPMERSRSFIDFTEETSEIPDIVTEFIESLRLLPPNEKKECIRKVYALFVPFYKKWISSDSEGLQLLGKYYDDSSLYNTQEVLCVKTPFTPGKISNADLPNSHDIVLQLMRYDALSRDFFFHLFITNMVHDSLHDIRILDNIVMQLLPILKSYLDKQPDTSNKRVLIQNLMQISQKFTELL